MKTWLFTSLLMSTLVLPGSCKDAKEEKNLPSGKPLVVYFSATGNTKAVAEQIAKLTGADICRIEAAEAYKNVARKYIFSAPMSAAAYFALFQQIDGLLFFDLYDKADSKAYGAVATSYDHFYPESPRSKHLHNLALQSIKVLRGQRPLNLDNIKTEEISFLDIDLPTVTGQNTKLSDLAKGKVVIVNFTAYQAEWSPSLNMELGKVYNNYHDKGLEIYQISLDTDVHFWKNAASNLPWMCVRDPESVYSQAAALYNVKQLPAVFILDKNGNLVKRLDNINNLESSIKSLL